MRYHQRGLSAISWLALLSTVGIVVLCAFKMVPVYVEHVYVEDALKFIVDSNKDLKALSKQNIEAQLNKYMIVNSVGPEQSNSFEIKRFGDHLLINSNYEVRVPLVHNIDVVMSFRSQLDTSKPENCCVYIIENWNED